MSQHMPAHDPRSRFEDEGIPDLQDSTPERQWAVDPQEAPVPADEPAAVDDYGTTGGEQAGDESLGHRLEREEPDRQPRFGGGSGEPGGAGEEPPGADVADTPLSADSGLGVGSDLDTRYERGPGVDPQWPAQPEEPSGRVWDEPRPAGRLIAPGEGTHPDTEKDEIADEVGPDSGGYSAEEAAMRVEPE